MIHQHNFDVVELSALRVGELRPLAEAISELDLRRFHFVSIHAPSKFAPEEEADVVRSSFQVGSRSKLKRSLSTTMVSWQKRGTQPRRQTNF
jgi:hypothetical protein